MRKDFITPEKYCEYCGSKLERRRYAKKYEDKKIFMKRKYCNVECMRRAFTNVGYNNANWSNTHATARNINKLFLHKEVCEICGKTGKLDIHHIDNNENNNNLDNLMCLCRSCHMKTHRTKGFREGVVVNE